MPRKAACEWSHRSTAGARWPLPPRRRPSSRARFPSTPRSRSATRSPGEGSFMAMRREWWWLLVPVSLAAGWAIAAVDSSPGWDDTGITGAALFGSALILGALRPDRAWLWALAIGIWVPALGIRQHQNYGTLLALAFAFAGAY